MANRYPLIIDTADANKIKELQTGDNLNLADNSIVGVQNITALGTIEAAVLTVNGDRVVAQSFIGLADTPANYTASANSFVAVNAAGNALEFKALSAFGTIGVSNINLVGNVLPTVTNTSTLGSTSLKFAELHANNVYSNLRDYNNTLVFDATTGKIPYTALIGTPTNVSEFTNDSGFQTVSGTNVQIQNFFGGGGTLTADITGSVFANDSTMLVDGTTGTLVGNIHYPTTGSITAGTKVQLGTTELTSTIEPPTANTGAIGTTSKRFGTGYFQNINASGNVTAATFNGTLNGILIGEHIGSVYGDDSTVIIDGVSGMLYGDLTGTVSGISNHSIDALSDVDTTTAAPTTGQTIIWNGTNFVPGAAFSAGDFNTAFAGKNVSDLADVYTTGVSDGQTLVYSTGNSRFEPGYADNGIYDGDLTGSVFADDSSLLVDGVNAKLLFTNNTLADLANVSGNTPTAGQVLKWDGSQWAPGTDITSGGAGTDADTLDGQDSPYFLAWGNFTGTPTTLSGYGITDAITAATLGTATATLTNKTFDQDGTGNSITNLANASIKAAAGIDATKIADGTVTSTEFQYIGGLTSDAQTQITAKAALTDISVQLGGASGGGSIAYNNATGVITLSPANLTAINIVNDTSPQLGGTLDANGNTIDMGTNTITDTKVGQWDTAVTWGDHGSNGYLTSTGQLSSHSDVHTATPTNGQVLTWDQSNTRWAPAAAGGGGSIGNFTFASSNIDTDDSSGITLTPAITFESDVTVQNDLVVNNTITANKFVSSAVGSPKITSATNIELNAGGAVIVGSSALRLYTVTTTQRNALTAATGDIIYNSTLMKYQVRIGSAWKSLTISDDVPTNNNQLTNGAGYLTAAPENTFTMTSNGSNDYVFAADSKFFPTAENDPVLYVTRGQTYNFVNNSGGSHPFQLRTSNGGGAYNTGVTNNGAASGTIKWTVPMTAPSSIYYQCTAHSNMGNTINVIS
jgi:hypothetical protein|tara:strand:+ start:10055 stop:12973 length:2919 start_codon:yes stop_codon:yes gene_type:complete